MNSDHLSNELEELRETINSIPALVLRCRADGIAEFLNQRWLNYTGFTLEDSLGRGWQRAVHPEDLPRLMDSWRALLVSGKSGEAEVRIRRNSGEYRWFLFRAEPIHDAGGKVTNWCCTNTDIEDRKRAEERARQAESELKAIIDTIPVIAARYTGDGVLDFVNKTWQEFTGLATEVLNNRPRFVVAHPADEQRMLDSWADYVATGEPFVDEYRIRRADGQYRWFLAHWMPFRDESGKIINWYAIGYDIDDRKRAEERAREAEDELRTLIDTIPAI